MSKTGSYIGGSTIISMGRSHAAPSEGVLNSKKRDAKIDEAIKAEWKLYEIRASQGVRIIDGSKVPETQNDYILRKRRKINKKNKKLRLKKLEKEFTEKSLGKCRRRVKAKKAMEKCARHSLNIELLVCTGMRAGLKRGAAEGMAKEIRFRSYGRN